MAMRMASKVVGCDRASLSSVCACADCHWYYGIAPRPTLCRQPHSPTSGSRHSVGPADFSHHRIWLACDAKYHTVKDTWQASKGTARRLAWSPIAIMSSQGRCNLLVRWREEARRAQRCREQLTICQITARSQPHFRTHEIGPAPMLRLIPHSNVRK